MTNNYNINCFKYQDLARQFADVLALVNDTLEERVTILEEQVAGLDDDINLIEAEQIIQNERILELQAESDGEYVRKRNCHIF